MNKLSMYGYYFLNFVTRGNLVKKSEVASDAVKSRFGNIYTRGYTKKVFIITSFTTLDIGNPIARVIRNELLQFYPKLRVFINQYNIPEKINIKDMTFLRRFNNEKDGFEAYNQQFSKMSKSEVITGKRFYTPNGRRFTIKESDFLKRRDTYRSFEYVMDKIKVENCEFFSTSYFVEILIPNNLKVPPVLERFNNIADNLGIEVMPLEHRTSKFLSNYSLTATLKERNKFPTVLFSSENLAMNSSFMSPGVVASNGMLIGKDLLSNMPFMPDFLCTHGAKVSMIISESGYGKTYMAMDIASQMKSFNIHTSVLDLKGGEWAPALRKMGIKVLEIGMDNKSGTYVNFLRLDDFVTKDMSKDDIDDIFDMALTGTETLLSTMVSLQENEGNPVDVSGIIREAVTKLYTTSASKGFNRLDPKTYYITKDFTYQQVLEIISDIGKNSVKDSTNVANYDTKRAMLCKLIYDRCSQYVQAPNSFGSLFKEEITVRDVIESECVVYNMGLNSNSQIGVSGAVKFIMISYLDMKKQYIRKKLDLYTAAFYEEVQRFNNFKQLINFLSNAVTGGRSNNMLLFLLLNAISVFDNDEFKMIKSNITSVFAGKLKREDIEVLVRDFSCSDIEEYMYNINPTERLEKKSNLLKENNLGSAFAARFKTGETTYDKTIFRVELPEDISDFYQTTSKV